MATDAETDIVHRQLDTGQANPAVALSEHVADLKGVDPSELQPVWERIDDLLSEVFSNPPTAAAQAEVTFSYEGFRITVEHDGRAKFVKMA